MMSQPTTQGRTLLDRLDQLTNIDVDNVDTAFVAALPIRPHNMTSNHAIMAAAVLAEHNRDMFTEIVSKYAHEGWEAIFDRMSVRICKRNINLISGRLLVQASPRYTKDKNATIAQCQRFAKFFEEEGISKDRFGIKLIFTGANALAAAELNAEGIRTLATGVFGLEQAIAASQAKCSMVSPYFNEIAAHFDPKLHPQPDDVALQHPMSSRVIQILATYAALYKETGEEQPTMVIASQLSVPELMALGEIGCGHITISGKLLQALSTTEDTLPPPESKKPTHLYANYAIPARLLESSRLDPLAPVHWDGVWASAATDFLADDAKKLDEAILADESVVRRLRDATDYFMAAEAKVKEAIEMEISRRSASAGASVRS